MPGTIRLVDLEGTIRDVPVEAAAGALEAGWHVPTDQEQLARTTAQAREEQFGGVGGAIKAGLAGAARGATLGLSDVAARAIGGDDAAIALEGLRAANPITSTATEIGGAIAPALVTGGASLPAGAASAAGRGAAAAAGGGIRGAIAGGALEGAIQGVGQGVTELALSTDPLTLERAASAISSNALYGGLVGGAAGGAFKAAEVGLVRAKGAIDNALARKAVSDTEPDLAVLIERGDRAGLKAAHDEEVAAIRVTQQPEREAFVTDLQNVHRSNEGAKEWLAIVADRHDDKYTREAAKVLFNQDRKIRNVLDNRVKLAQQPERALDALQTERQAIEALIERGKRDVDDFYTAFESAPVTVREELIANKIPGYVVGKGAIDPRSPAFDDLVERIALERFPRYDSGVPVIPKELTGFVGPDLDLRLAENVRLQARIGKLVGQPTSERLKTIEDAIDRLSSPREKSLGEHILGAAVPFTGPMGTVAAAGGRALGGLRRAAAAAARRAGEAASSFLGAAGKAAGKTAPYAPLVATKVLAQVRYAETDRDDDKDDEPKSKTRLAKLYKARTDEIKTQTAFDETGVPRMRPAARAAVAERLKPIRAVDPIAADRIETAAARRIEYLSSLIPRRPIIAGAPIGPDHWQPSDVEMRSWARSAAAVEDPYAVLERAAHGGVTPEDVAAMRAVHPEILNDFIAQVSAELPTLRHSLPVARQISLSLLTGIAVTPMMDPSIMAVLQAQYQFEPEQPRAQPQFGSVKSQDMEPPTPAQRRELGAAT